MEEQREGGGGGELRVGERERQEVEENTLESIPCVRPFRGLSIY